MVKYQRERHCQNAMPLLDVYATCVYVFADVFIEDFNKASFH